MPSVLTTKDTEDTNGRGRVSHADPAPSGPVVDFVFLVNFVAKGLEDTVYLPVVHSPGQNRPATDGMKLTVPSGRSTGVTDTEYFR